MIITSNNFRDYSKIFFRKAVLFLQWVMIGMFLTSCTKMNLTSGNGIVIPVNTPVLVGPFSNHSDTPLANRQVESIVVGLMHAKGFRNVSPFPRQQSCDKLMYCPDEGMTNAKLIHWARAHKFAYVLTGAANEWRYKVGLDGEPVAGVSLVLLNAQTGSTVWTSVGSIIGGSRQGLDVVGQKMLISELQNISPALVK